MLPGDCHRCEEAAEESQDQWLKSPSLRRVFKVPKISKGAKRAIITFQIKNLVRQLYDCKKLIQRTQFLATETISFNKMNSHELKFSTLLVLFLSHNDLTRLFQVQCYFPRCTLGMCVLRRRVICGGLIQPVHNCSFGILAQAKKWLLRDTQVVLLAWWQEKLALAFKTVESTVNVQSFLMTKVNTNTMSIHVLFSFDQYCLLM